MQLRKKDHENCGINLARVVWPQTIPKDVFSNQNGVVASTPYITYWSKKVKYRLIKKLDKVEIRLQQLDNRQS